MAEEHQKAWWLDTMLGKEKCEAALAWEARRRTTSYRAVWRRFIKESPRLLEKPESPAVTLFWVRHARHALGQLTFDYLMSGFNPDLTWLELTKGQRLRAQGFVLHPTNASASKLDSQWLLCGQQTRRPRLDLGMVELGRSALGQIELVRKIRGGFAIERIAETDPFRALHIEAGKYVFVYFDARGARDALLDAFDAELGDWVGKWQEVLGQTTAQMPGVISTAAVANADGTVTVTYTSTSPHRLTEGANVPVTISNGSSAGLNGTFIVAVIGDTIFTYNAPEVVTGLSGVNANASAKPSLPVAWDPKSEPCRPVDFWCPSESTMGVRPKRGEVAIVPSEQPGDVILLVPATHNPHTVRGALHTQLKTEQRKCWFSQCVNFWGTPKVENLAAKERQDRSGRRDELWLGLAANDVICAGRAIGPTSSEGRFLLEQTGAVTKWRESRCPGKAPTPEPLSAAQRRGAIELRNHQRSAAKLLVELDEDAGRQDKKLAYCNSRTRQIANRLSKLLRGEIA